MRQAIAPRVRALLLLFVAVTGALLAGAVPVSAHAALTGSDPQQGAVVKEAPTQVSLTFSEKIAMSDGSVRVYDPKGKQVDTGKTSDLGGNAYGVKLHSGLPEGTFTVTYQAVSADSHPISGAYTFSVGAPSKTTAAVPEQTAGGGIVGGLYGFARYAAYAGFILLVGGAAFVLACWQRGAGIRPVQRLVVSGWLTLTAATLAMLLLRGSYTGSGKVGDIFDLTLLGTVLQTKSGAALVSRLLLLAAAALFIAVLFGAYARRDEAEENANGDGQDSETDAESPAHTDSDPHGEGDGDSDAEPYADKKDLTFGLAIGGSVVAAGLAASWAMAEHASAGIQTGIAMPVDVVHLLAVATWLGGLAALLVALFRAPAEAPVEAAAVHRFSRVAFGSVLVLTATGVYQSWRQVGSWSALTGTSYGQLLLVKIGLVVVLVGIAWISRRWTALLADTPAESVASPASPASVASGAVQRTDGARTDGARKAVISGGGAKGASTTLEGSAPATEDEVRGSEDSADSGQDSEDPERAAQLARQRAAMATTREKRIRDADPGRRGLRRSVLAEAAVALVVLAVTTALTVTEPGRTVEEAEAATSAAQQSDVAGDSGALALDIPFDTGSQDGKGVVRVDIDPARVGGNEMHVYVQRSNGRVFDIPEVKVAFTLKAKDIGPLPVVPDRIATGHWTAIGVQIPMAGNWEVAVTVRTSDIDQVTVTKNAQIG
ncbi:copper resistance protein CopC/CopD [Streptomyces sp. KM273126]|uniref:copper resistance CopC/CopD family protein n=1 Tax=Streptomyces sp. KM273126 TaxID=2545247 RepID=UPI00103CBE98|nr:copper resistance protein CopC [Streptomyces sp. KM273126]MBA2807455.1 copper resistance protein CopC/CopD [Streptomyces sp. KM273126]